MIGGHTLTNWVSQIESVIKRLICILGIDGMYNQGWIQSGTRWGGCQILLSRVTTEGVF